MRLLVTGVSGAIGSQLAARLADGGHDVVGMSRTPDELAHAPSNVELVVGDVVNNIGLDEALRDVEVAYYLIHSLEPSPHEFAERERHGATNFAVAARRTGVARVIYLGGLAPARRPYSAHFDARLEVEKILMGALPNSTALRAPLVVDARSRSFRLIVALIERMRTLPLGSWRNLRTQPIDGRDVIEALVHAATDVGCEGATLDIVGPETVTYGDLIARIAELMALHRPIVGIDLDTASLTGRIAAQLTGENEAFTLPLTMSLSSDLLARESDGLGSLGVKPHTLDAAIEHALSLLARVDA